VVREGLVTILGLQDDLEVVGQARDGEEAYRLYEQLRPDILILDLRMPKKDGLQVVTELMAQRPRPRIIVLTNSPKAGPSARALRRRERLPLKGCRTSRSLGDGSRGLRRQIVAPARDSRAVG
jgi:DNA-binding NarL/FixJ family response regulator